MQNRTILSYILSKYVTKGIYLRLNSRDYKPELIDIFDTLIENIEPKRVLITKGTSRNAIDYFLRKGCNMEYSDSLDLPVMEYLSSLGILFLDECRDGVIMNDIIEYEHVVAPDIGLLIRWDSSGILNKMLDKGRITIAEVIGHIKSIPATYYVNGLRQLYLVVKWAIKNKKFDPILKTIVPLPVYSSEYDELIGRINTLCANLDNGVH
jgi:hypothetical protein